MTDVSSIFNKNIFRSGLVLVSNDKITIKINNNKKSQEMKKRLLNEKSNYDWQKRKLANIYYLEKVKNYLYKQFVLNLRDKKMFVYFLVVFFTFFYY